MKEIYERLCGSFPHSESHRHIAQILTQPDNATYAWYDGSDKLMAVWGRSHFQAATWG